MHAELPRDLAQLPLLEVSPRFEGDKRVKITAQCVVREKKHAILTGICTMLGRGIVSLW